MPSASTSASSNNRIHPYSSQNRPVANNGAEKKTSILKPKSGIGKGSIASVPIFQNSLPSTTASKIKSNQNSSNYEFQSYLTGNNSKQTNVYPTMRAQCRETDSFKGILKNRTNDPTRSSKLSDGSKWTKNAKKANQPVNNTETNEEMNCLKIFCGTTKSIKFYTPKFNEVNKKTPSVGSYLFEIIAQLDSAITHDENSGVKEFTIKDQYDRMPCVFHEIDLEMEKLIRGSYIRCVGKFSSSKSIFQCMSVRLAKRDELFAFGFNVNRTNSHVKSTYL